MSSSVSQQRQNIEESKATKKVKSKNKRCRQKKSLIHKMLLLNLRMHSPMKTLKRRSRLDLNGRSLPKWRKNLTILTRKSTLKNRKSGSPTTI